MAFQASVHSVADTQTELTPPMIGSFFTALNAGDVPKLLRHFSANTVINDQMQEFIGEKEILSWAERDVVGVDMYAEILTIRLRKSGAIVSAKVTGNFDAPGLPEPLILLFYFVVGANEIDQLIILRADL